MTVINMRLIKNSRNGKKNEIHAHSTDQICVRVLTFESVVRALNLNYMAAKHMTIFIRK